jgi:hypothetical protein
MRIIFCFVSIIFFGGQVFGQGHEEIRKKVIPLSSLRKDVEKIPGLVVQRESSNEHEGKYKTPDKEITVYYANSPCVDHGWNVKSGTVLGYQIVAISPSKFDRAALKGQIVEISDDAGYKHLTDIRAGVQYVLDAAGLLRYVRYFPSQRNKSLRCRGFPKYTPINSSYQLFDSFEIKNISSWDVGLLANTLVESRRRSDFMCYIFIYHAKNQKNKIGLFKKKVENYAFNILKADPRRVRIVSGGLRDVTQIETFLIPLEYPEPMATPKYGH